VQLLLVASTDDYLHRDRIGGRKLRVDPDPVAARLWRARPAPEHPLLTRITSDGTRMRSAEEPVDNVPMRRRVDVAGDHETKADDEMLRAFLRAQRESVLLIVEGLDEEAWHRPVVPTGWTPAGLLEHLGGAEWHWFQGVVAGKQPELPEDLDEDQPPYDPLTVVFKTDERSAEVVTFYRDQCAQSEVVLATTPLSAPPLGEHGHGEFEPPNVRWVVLHMIEETARHAGHLDIARELLDGSTRLGGR
jgi:Protein of unknown function (DUF664)